MVAWNSEEVEGVDLFDFEELLAEDVDCKAWDGLDLIQDDEEVFDADEVLNEAY